MIQREACDRCTQGVMDADRVIGGRLVRCGNPHLYGRCPCACHNAQDARDRGPALTFGDTE